MDARQVIKDAAKIAIGAYGDIGRPAAGGKESKQPLRPSAPPPQKHKIFSPEKKHPII